MGDDEVAEGTRATQLAPQRHDLRRDGDVDREHRFAASMVEVLVLGYAKAHGLAVPDPNQPARKGSPKAS